MPYVTFIVRGQQEEAASSKYRVYQYLDYLTHEKIRWSVIIPPRRKIVHAHLWAIFFARLFFYGLLSRIIFIQKDIFSLTVWRLFKFAGKKIIYDFDDPIFIPDATGQQSFFSFLGLIQPRSDLPLLIKMLKISDCVIVANKYLEKFASQHSKKTMIIPMTLNTEDYPLKEKKEEYPVIIGWIGSPHTSPYLSLIREALEKLQLNYGPQVKIKIISNGLVDLPNVDFEQVPWLPEEEIKNILSFDIGLAPLPDNKWTRGKSSYKLLQYMASGLPTVCSAVGFNQEIVVDGENGMLASHTDEWTEKLSKLVSDATLRSTLGFSARKTIESQFSLRSNSELFARTIQNL